MKIKICGLSRIADIDAVNHALPDYIGFVFTQSKRQVDIKIAAALKEKLDARIKTVGVFVNEEADKIAEICKKGIIDVVQLHGNETDEYINSIKNLCACKIIKSVGIIDSLPNLPNTADYLLFDSVSKQGGGAGKAFCWEALQNYSGIPWFLAGGLDNGNIIRALNMLKPYGVDVSSGVETNGIKDAEKIYEFVRIARGFNNG